MVTQQELQMLNDEWTMLSFRAGRKFNIQHCALNIKE